ncbi:hypothetical protein V9T40_008323 [Parthenolecanium corni]|uniref:Uncharacterized protein n=1 Tax=Parthenolecanium corni TaxID=536013 RepID=A0AAN9TNC1_9HEMI
MTSYFLLFNLVAVLCTTFAHPAANDLKAKFAEDNEISPSKFSAKGVSAEFGGYKVAAGLGGGDTGGGLFAKAEAPSASAGAGAYGGAAGSAAGGANANAGVSGFGGFDSNKPGQNGGDAGHHGAGAAASASAGPDSTLSTETRFAVDPEDGSVAGASATASAGSGTVVAGKKIRGKPDYDRIFNVLNNSDVIKMLKFYYCPLLTLHLEKIRDAEPLWRT